MEDSMNKDVKSLIGNRLWGLPLIFLLTFLAYSNIFQNQFVMDDFDFIVNWPLIRDWRNLPSFFSGYTPPAGQEGIYSPFKTLIHAVNYHLFGLNPLGYHVFSFLVHFAAIYYVYKLSFFFTQDKTVTFFSSLFFALHPVHADVIASMTGNVDVAGIIFLLMAFYYYVKSTAAIHKDGRRFYVYALLASFVSVFTHELCLPLPILFLWYDFCFRGGDGQYRRIFSRVWPFFAIAFFYILCKYLVLQSITRGSYIYGSFYLTMLVMIKAWAKYVLVCFAPTVLTHNHVISPGVFSFDPEDFDKVAVLSQSFFEPQVLLSLGLLVGIFYVAAMAWKPRRLVTFCVGWFFVSLLSASNIVPSGVYFGERYLYHGLWGFCLLLAVYCRSLLRRQGSVLRTSFRWMGIVLIGALIVFYGLRTWLRNTDLRNEIVLFERAVKANPYSALLRTDLGLIYIRSQMPEKAVASLEKALEIRPDDPVIYFSLAEAYVQLHKIQESADALEYAIFLKEEYPEAHFNLAGVYASQGFHEKAQQSLKSALYYYRLQGKAVEAQEAEAAFKNYFGF